MLKPGKLMTVILLTILLPLTPVFAIDETPSDIESSEKSEETAELAISPKEGVTGVWELRAGEEVLAEIKSREGRTFKIYKPDGIYMGYVYDSLNWVPKDARQKRELKLLVEDVKLFLDILQAEGTYAPVIGGFKLKADDTDENKWDIVDEDENFLGTVEKAEQRYKFYAGDSFMGYLGTSGVWIPKLGINRREMRITPEQATFCLNVFMALTGR